MLCFDGWWCELFLNGPTRCPWENIFTNILHGDREESGQKTTGVGTKKLRATFFSSPSLSNLSNPMDLFVFHSKRTLHDGCKGRVSKYMHVM